MKEFAMHNQSLSGLALAACVAPSNVSNDLSPNMPIACTSNACISQLHPDGVVCADGGRYSCRAYLPRTFVGWKPPRDVPFELPVRSNAKAILASHPTIQTEPWVLPTIQRLFAIGASASNINKQTMDQIRSILPKVLR